MKGFLRRLFGNWKTKKVSSSTAKTVESRRGNETATLNDDPSNIEASIVERLSDFPLTIEVRRCGLTVFRVQSFSNEGTGYVVSLSEQTCTCPDFEKLRKNRPKNDLSRFCKHLMWALSDSDLFTDLKPWHKAIVEDGFGGPFAANFLKMDRSPDVLLTFQSGSDWINVYAHKKKAGEKISQASGPIDCYGWNVIEKRWSYGVGPAGARELRKYLSPIEEYTIKI